MTDDEWVVAEPYYGFDRPPNFEGRAWNPRVSASLEVVAERKPGVLVFGPDRACLRRRTYERAAKRIRERSSSLVWLAPD